MIGKRIKQLREEQNLNQIELSKKLNISNTTLSQYETGQRVPSDDIKIKMADFFDCSLDYLIGYSNIRKRTDQHTSKEEQINIPDSFKDAEEALKFILDQPVLMAYGGYDLKSMSEEEILEIAENMLFSLKISLEKRKKKKGE